MGPPTSKEWDDCQLSGGGGEPGSYVLKKLIVDIPPKDERGNKGRVGSDYDKEAL